MTSENPIGGPPTSATDASASDGQVSKVSAPPSGPISRVGLGLTSIQRGNPWPEFPYGEVEPFTLALDSNGKAGRDLIVDVIRERRISLMVEVGCFLCGSTLQWLRASDCLTVIGVDPWDGNWAFYIEHIAAHPVMKRSVSHLTEAQIAAVVANLRQHGNFGIAMNNVRAYKHRFHPVRRRSPEALRYLHLRRIVPELIYIDADKQREDLDVAHELFPRAVLCGDDWLWPDETGVFRMQEHVKSFAADHGFEVRSSIQSWLLVPAKQGGA
jgi:hypothetical protein